MAHVREFMSSRTAVQRAAAGIARALIAADLRAGHARLAIPGGSAVQLMAPLLPLLPEAVRARLRLTWVDERCVPLADPASNRGAAERAGLVPDCARVLPLWSDDASPAAACERVVAGLAADFAGGLDVALLGLGEDGHIASLFPGHPALASDEPVLHIADSPKPPARRMTLGLSLLQRAGLCVVLATGEGKRDALVRLQRADKALPATALGRLIVFTDLEDLEGFTDLDRLLQPPSQAQGPKR
jgi:6-phosphogluconolactonase